jgi:hypothetical protein
MVGFLVEWNMVLLNPSSEVAWIISSSSFAKLEMLLVGGVAK